MGIFNSIKKSRRESSDIDEKIEYLNKELEKTGLHEVMTTSNMYFSGEKVPNQDYNDFEGTSEGGYGLALSGADGNNVGNAVIQTGEGGIAGVEGVAYSPPHPITGLRTYATHVSTGLGDRVPLRPGVTIGRGFSDNPPQYTMGSVLWFFDPTYNFGGQQGQWCYFEWSNFENNTGWGWWDTIKTGQFAGIYTFNKNLSQHPCAGDDIADKIAGLNFSLNGAVGAPQTTVLFKKDLGDPDHLPINIPGLSGEAFNYLFAGANYDLYNWILKTYGMPAAEWYLKTGKSQGNPYLPGGAYVPRADAGEPVSDTDIPGPFAGAQDGDEFAFFGGNNNKNETPKKPTKKTRKGATDATAAATGGYSEMTPEIFQQKYGMSWQEYMNLP